MTHDIGAPCWSQGAPATPSHHSHLEQTMPETTDPQPERKLRVAAYRSPGTRTLYCVICARQESGWQPVAVADVQGEAACDFCGGLVLAVAAQTLGDVVARYMPPAAPADRAAILREAAEKAKEIGYARAATDADRLLTVTIAEGLRRAADQATDPSRMAVEAPAPSRAGGETQQPKICELPHLTIAEEDACEQHRLGDQAQQPETQAQCPGFETQPNRCSCGCEGCRHNCAAHQTAAVSQPGKEA